MKGCCLVMLSSSVIALLLSIWDLCDCASFTRSSLPLFSVAVLSVPFLFPFLCTRSVFFFCSGILRFCGWFYLNTRDSKFPRFWLRVNGNSDSAHIITATRLAQPISSLIWRCFSRPNKTKKTVKNSPVTNVPTLMLSMGVMLVVILGVNAILVLFFVLALGAC